MNAWIAAAYEILASIRLVRSFGKEPAEKARFGSQVLSKINLLRGMGGSDD
jgi:hypothetical protein